MLANPEHRKNHPVNNLRPNFRLPFHPWWVGLLLIGLVAGNLQAQNRVKNLDQPQFSNLDALNPSLLDGSRRVITLTYTAYQTAFDPLFQQPIWVSYRLNRERVGGGAERSSGFWNEPRLKSQDASDEDYKGSGMDRGHLVPAADMAWSVRTMHESFSYANVSPQRPGFNRGIWKRLENQVRTWASDLSANDTLGLMVWAGPVLEPEPERWGRLLVPQRFYKIVYHPAQKRVVACLMQNAASQEEISATMVTVDSIENITGLDFLAGLPDDEEERLESGLCRTCWVWTKPVRR